MDIHILLAIIGIGLWGKDLKKIDLKDWIFNLMGLFGLLYKINII